MLVGNSSEIYRSGFLPSVYSFELEKQSFSLLNPMKHEVYGKITRNSQSSDRLDIKRYTSSHL